ncbi:MAG: hypothetical protein WBM83_01765, partial [Flavobacteriaceae bacterium]
FMPEAFENPEGLSFRKYWYFVGGLDNDFLIQNNNFYFCVMFEHIRKILEVGESINNESMSLS